MAFIKISGRYLEMGDEYEKKFVAQRRDEDRGINDTLDLGWELLGIFPENELTRIDPEMRRKHYKSQ